MTTSDPIKTFQNTFSSKGVIQHYEKLKVADAVDFDEALENFEVLYKNGVAKSTPVQLSKLLRDVLVGNFKIETALSKLKGGTVVKPPKLVATGLAVASCTDIAIRRLVHSDIVGSIASCDFSASDADAASALARCN